MGEQLTLFPDKKQLKKQSTRRGAPSWDDVLNGLATVTHHERYSQPCKSSCMWTDCIGDYGGMANCCYLFRRPIINGRCPSTAALEWTE